MVIIIRLVGEHCIAAIAEVEKARQLDPRSVTVRFRESSIMERRDNLAGALKVAQESLKTDKDDYYAKRALVSISLLRGDYAKVVESGNERFSHPNLKSDPRFQAILRRTNLAD